MWGEGQHSEFIYICFAYWSLGVDLQHRMFPQAWPLNTMGYDMLSHLFPSKRITGIIQDVIITSSAWDEDREICQGKNKSIFRDQKVSSE